MTTISVSMGHTVLYCVSNTSAFPSWAFAGSVWSSASTGRFNGVGIVDHDSLTLSPITWPPFCANGMPIPRFKYRPDKIFKIWITFSMSEHTCFVTQVISPSARR